VGNLAKLNDSRHAQVFRAVAETLRADPVLSEVVDCWVDWQGDAAGAGGAAKPDLATQVTLRLWPAGVGESLASSNQSQRNLRIVVEATVPGTRAEDCLNLWAAIAGGGVDDRGQQVHSALYPGDKSLYERLTALGCGFYQVTDPAIADFEHADGVGLMAMGVVEVDLKLRTRI
jgi:hypothetical protein